MKLELERIKEKVKKFFDKSLKNKNDVNINSQMKDEAEYRKSHGSMKNY